MKKPNLVIFDGSNFYHGAKKLHPKKHLTNLNYSKFAFLVTGTNNNRVEYCVGEIRQERGNKKSEYLYSNQQALFYSLQKQGVEVFKGFMLKTRGIYHEKGVDVRIAINILKGALKNTYNKCYVISSDTDVIPAIQDSIQEGKEVIYVGFRGQKVRALEKNCFGIVEITKSMLTSC